MVALGAFGVVQPNFIKILGPATPGDFDDARWMPFAQMSESGFGWLPPRTIRARFRSP